MSLTNTLKPKVNNKPKIWLSSPHIGVNEQVYVQEAFDANWIAPLGPNVNQFEKDLENHIGTGQKVAALSSGTAALHLALILAGVGEGDIVLCQSFTFSASANPIVYQGARPVFIDSESSTWNMCPELLEKAIKACIAKNRKPKAIVAVHLYGMPYMADEINALAKRYDITVIEDSAEALGSTYKNNCCGTLGDYGVFSFNGNKIITTSGGGALVTSSEEQKRSAVHLATQARDNAPHYQHSTIGYNYRLSNVLAGIGRGQMEVLNSRVDARRNNFEYYRESLAELDEIFFLEEPEGFTSNRWLSCILTPSFSHRENIRFALEKENIESRPLWKPMHSQPVFEDCEFFSNGVSDDLFEKGLCLPSGSNLTEDNLNSISQIIKETILS
ncbi:DegT/DnrJ/EryC1/StrS family aminotransferase [uncultured Croceitalea sp.]|uniref:DegT/DnrJ/EryC1/StrS family aminotransferase n=1 Tax=uncultured Croceitalea sp. TaxID=1798908 RepID=UPI003305BEB5